MCVLLIVLVMLINFECVFLWKVFIDVVVFFGVVGNLINWLLVLKSVFMMFWMVLIMVFLLMLNVGLIDM